MKKAVLFATIALVLGAWTFGCTTVVIKEDKGPEVLLPAEVMESVNADTVSLQCDGIGFDKPGAILQARKACIDWYITNKLAPTASERKNYEAVQQAFFNQLDKYVGQPPVGTKDGKGPGVKSRARIDEERIKVRIIVHVNTKALKADLVAKGVIQDSGDLMDSVGMPSLVAVPSKASKAKKLTKEMAAVVDDYLTSNNLNVKDIGNIQNMEKVFESLGEISGAEENEAAQIALAAGADVYFVYEGNRDKKADSIAYSATVTAFETVTSTKLGTKKTIGEARFSKRAGEESKALDEPFRDSMGKLMPRVMEYWKRTAPKGQRYMIQFNGGDTSKTKRAIMKILKRNCSNRKMITADDKMVRYEAQCKMANDELSIMFEEEMPKHLDGATVKWVSVTGSMLLGNVQ